MTLVPNRATVTSPVEETEITVLSIDVHVVSELTSLTVPSENVALAVSWLVSPTAVNATLPVTLRRVTCAGDVAGGGTEAGAVALLLHPVHITITPRSKVWQPRTTSPRPIVRS